VVLEEVAGDFVSTFLVAAVVSVFLFLAYFLLQEAQWTVVSEISNRKFLQLGHFKVNFLGVAVAVLDVLDKAETVVVEAFGGVVVVVLVLAGELVGVVAVVVVVVGLVVEEGDAVAVLDEEFLCKVGVFFTVLVTTVLIAFGFLSVGLLSASFREEVVPSREILIFFEGEMMEPVEFFKLVVGAVKVKGLGLGPLAEALA